MTETADELEVKAIEALRERPRSPPHVLAQRVLGASDHAAISATKVLLNQMQAAGKVVRTTGGEYEAAAVGAPPPAAEATSASEVMGRTALMPQERVAALDAAVAQCRDIIGRGAQQMWELGRALLKIELDGLWKCRVDPDGQQVYRSAAHFAGVELRISQNGYGQAMRFANKFTREELYGHSVVSANLISRVRLPEERQRLLSCQHHWRIHDEVAALPDAQIDGPHPLKRKKVMSLPVLRRLLLTRKGLQVQLGYEEGGFKVQVIDGAEHHTATAPELADALRSALALLAGDLHERHPHE